jgi:predicted amidophosphoribosyltransferase
MSELRRSELIDQLYERLTIETDWTQAQEAIWVEELKRCANPYACGGCQQRIEQIEQLARSLRELRQAIEQHQLARELIEQDGEMVSARRWTEYDRELYEALRRRTR